MAVAKAKEARNIPALVALLEQGNYEAVAALKELNDQTTYAQGLANHTAMSQEDTLPVLEQLVGNLEAPQSGIAAYASGGRAFSGGGENYAQLFTDSMPRNQKPLYAPSAVKRDDGSSVERPAEPYLPQTAAEALMAPPDPNSRDLGDWLRKVLYGGKTREEYYKEAPAAKPGQAAQQAGSAYPDQVQARSPATNKETVRKPRYSGIAAAAAPAETSLPSDGPFDPKKRMQRQEGAGMPSLPAAEDQTDDQLRQSLEALTTLQKERDELRGKSRAQLEAAYNAKVKNLTPSKFDRVMEFLAGVSAKGGSSAAQALGAGALAMHGKDKARKEQLASVKEMYDKADLLEQEALVRDRMKDVEGAMALRKQAADLQRQIAAQKSTENLQGAQADYYRGARTDQAQAAAAASRARANRPTGIAAGVKPIDPVKRANLIRQEADALAKAEGKDLEIMTPTQREALTARATRIVDTNLGKPAAASPAGGQRLKFDAQGNLIQ
jgi:hypothetical protein